MACSFVVTVAAAGCSVDTSEPAGDDAPSTAEARGRAGKADLPGSCKLSDCGGKSSGACYCDELCADYGDCCSNAKQVCNLSEDECTHSSDCSAGFCGYEQGGARVCKPWAGIGESCGGFVPQHLYTECAPKLACDYPEPTHDVPGTCQPASCDPTLICGQALTCVNGQWYPTTCGPANCDQPMGPCPTVNPPPPPSPSCFGSCGGPSPSKLCFCDSVCTAYGDCCSDYQDLCL